MHCGHTYIHTHSRPHLQTDVVNDKIYLEDDCSSFIWRRGEHGQYQYFYKAKENSFSHPVSVIEYLSLLDRAEMQRSGKGSLQFLHKRKRLFVHKNVQFALVDVNCGQAQYLEALVEKGKELSLPPFVQAIGDRFQLVPVEDNSLNDDQLAITSAKSE